MPRDLAAAALWRIAGGDPSSLRIEEFNLEQCMRWKPWLTALVHLASQPGTSVETSSIVRRLRAHLDGQPDVEVFIDAMATTPTAHDEETRG